MNKSLFENYTVTDRVSDIYRYKLDDYGELLYPYDINGKEIQISYKKENNGKIIGAVIKENESGVLDWKEYNNLKELVEEWNENIIKELANKYRDKLDTALVMAFSSGISIFLFSKFVFNNDIVTYISLVICLLYLILFVVNNVFEYDVNKILIYEHVKFKIITEMKKFLHKALGTTMKAYEQYEHITMMKLKIKRIFGYTDEEKISNIEPDIKKENFSLYEKFLKEMEEVKSVKLKNKLKEVKEELNRIKNYSGNEEGLNEYCEKLLQIINISKNTLNLSVIDLSSAILDDYIIILSNHADNLLYNEESHLSELAELEILKKESESFIQYLKIK